MLDQNNSLSQLRYLLLSNVTDKRAGGILDILHLVIGALFYPEGLR